MEKLPEAKQAGRGIIQQPVSERIVCVICQQSQSSAVERRQLQSLLSSLPLKKGDLLPDSC